jgi:hydroxyacyl-ACP dehydratase HTD2-like protein with hotdog domain
MHFPHLHFIFFEQAIRVTNPANESGKTRPGSLAPAPNHIAYKNTRWHWEISFTVRLAAGE